MERRGIVIRPMCWISRLGSGDGRLLLCGGSPGLISAVGVPSRMWRQEEEANLGY